MWWVFFEEAVNNRDDFKLFGVLRIEPTLNAREKEKTQSLTLQY